ncbi:MAK10-like protein [Tanacetum coccineum]|uniref:MAK10-like protein n=1 Tax=Tanacetum coccineum TaxID=301880 RepID=A0ABQ5C6D8_9ASTR
MNSLVDQGSNVNVMPLSIYKNLTNERPAKTDIRLSLASHSYIYPLGIVEDVLVDVAGYVYPVDLMILDIKEDEKRPFILGTPFLTTTKVVIKFDKGTITLRSGKSKISFHMIPEPLCRKAHLLEDKQILTLGLLLEEIHATWAQLEKKRTKIRLYTNYFKEIHTERGDGVAIYKRWRPKIASEGIMDF